MIYRDLKEYVNSMTEKELDMSVYVLKDREIYCPECIAIVEESTEPSLLDKLQNEYALDDIQSLIII